jgi:hypothetical protein
MRESGSHHIGDPPPHSYYKLSDPRNCTHMSNRKAYHFVEKEHCPTVQHPEFVALHTFQHMQIWTWMVSSAKQHMLCFLLNQPSQNFNILMHVICMRKYCGHEKNYLKILTHFHALRPHEYENLFSLSSVCMYVCTHECVFQQCWNSWTDFIHNWYLTHYPPWVNIQWIWTLQPEKQRPFRCVP